jgi:hypothetical protein
MWIQMKTTQKHVAAMLVAGVVVSGLATWACADLLELKNGKVLQGSYNGGTATSIRFTAAGEMRSYPTLDILSVVFEATGAPAAVQTAAAVAAPPQAAPAPLPKLSGSASLPAGTTLTVKMDSALSTRSHRAGHQFIATLEADLVAGGMVAVPRGTKVYGVLAQSASARRLVGRSEMTIVLNKIMINNQFIPIATTPAVASSAKPAGRQTVGRTARAAAIGGLIDGSDGAKTGAKVGLGVSLLTRGASVDVPAGAMLDFKLSAPFAVSP